ncbi:hypothetical protein H6F67_09705 [Microcoleus sp. FACHB-1515]|uniref:hypothetical protein n=1 Tax=Cyanophyceae TaxID=3028117 RepID=UPI00168722EC|nr:hypothetical protein [Microcoleus sp. FACHB-1515]MBD2090127.1 hypothetical protein [Microcoleus sp. FACHB-1515]
MTNIPPAYANAIFGAAIFDLSGLPKAYFATQESRDSGWVQTVFQSLGLQSLLLSSLQLEGFRYARIHGNDHCAIVVKQRACYTALLLDRNLPEISSSTFVKWVQEFEPQSLKADSRFSMA